MSKLIQSISTKDEGEYIQYHVTLWDGRVLYINISKYIFESAADPEVVIMNCIVSELTAFLKNEVKNELLEADLIPSYSSKMIMAAFGVGGVSVTLPPTADVNCSVKYSDYTHYKQPEAPSNPKIGDVWTCTDPNSNLYSKTYRWIDDHIWLHIGDETAETFSGVSVEKSLESLVPTLRGKFSTCPVGNCSIAYELMSLIMHINDNHWWSREEIADWLDTLDIDLSIPTEGKSSNEGN